MMKARAIIGAGYGDEGKGLFIDFCTSHDTSDRKTVVRFNGGAQAGHTVVTPEGRRHVFHHFGSGAFAGAATHLSRFFVVHPMMFRPEREALLGAKAVTAVTVDPAALVTTPYDMIINQIVEQARSGARHGSCGLGFNECIERAQHGDFALTVAELGAGATALRARLAAIRQRWLPQRLQALGIAAIPDDFARLIGDDGMLEHYIEDCRYFRGHAEPVDDRRLRSLGQLLFEGAQGLMLDQAYGAFPHVTRSHTGLANIRTLAGIAGIDALDVTYLHRAYTTRHGAGPLPHEVPALGEFDVADATNIANPWQGSLRFAPLDLDCLRHAIDHDLRLMQGADLTVAIGISCLDQARGDVTIMEGDKPVRLAADNLAAYVARRLGVGDVYESWGPTRETMHHHRS